MKLLIFGRTGQVGRELERRRPSSVEAIFLSRKDVDLMEPEGAAASIRLYKPDAVINAAAWTDVDLAETHIGEATTVNGIAPGVMARECVKLDIPFLHISTDYVFDGSGEAPHRPHDPTSPINAYGRSKLRGEQDILASGAKALILRTSWVFSAHGKNFLKTMLRLGKERQSLNVVSDQIGGPTPGAAIADALYHSAHLMCAGHQGGLHHFAGAPYVSWADFARTIMGVAQCGCAIQDIPSSAYPTPARRPHNSRLDCGDFVRSFNMTMPAWRAGVVEAMRDIEPVIV